MDSALREGGRERQRGREVASAVPPSNHGDTVEVGMQGAWPSLA